MQGECDVIELREYLQHSHSFAGQSEHLTIYQLSLFFQILKYPFVVGKIIKDQRRMVLPFQPLSMSFRNISYYVDTPVVCYLITCVSSISFSFTCQGTHLSFEYMFLSGTEATRNCRRQIAAVGQCYRSIQAWFAYCISWGQWCW